MQNSIPLLDLAENVSIACDVFWRKQYFLRILNKNFEREGCQKKIQELKSTSDFQLLPKNRK